MAISGCQTHAVQSKLSVSTAFFSPNGWAVAVLVSSIFSGSLVAQSLPGTHTESRAEELLEKHASLAGQLATNSYARPLVLESSETSSMVNGNAYAVLDAPFSTVGATLKSPKRWCDVMILHINTKYCRAASDTSQSALDVYVGKKSAQALADAFALAFAFRVVPSGPDFLFVQLTADKGPLGTSNYRIELRAVPLPEGKTFMHLRYSYAYGLAGRLAMQTYLATVASDKVGFTQIGQGPKPIYVTGMRGTVERNTMRYYLAIDAYLASLSAPPAQQLNLRLERWFDATEHYPLQLHEVDRDSYLSMKKIEYQRQLTTSGSPG